MYDRAFGEMPEIETPKTRQYVKHAWHLYPILVNTDLLKIDRGEFIEALKAENIGTSVHFIPLHLHPYYQKAFGLKQGDFPVTELVVTKELEEEGYSPSKIVEEITTKENLALGEILAIYTPQAYFDRAFLYPLEKIKDVGAFGNIRKSGDYAAQHFSTWELTWKRRRELRFMPSTTVRFGFLKNCMFTAKRSSSTTALGFFHFTCI